MRLSNIAGVVAMVAAMRQAIGYRKYSGDDWRRAHVIGPGGRATLCGLVVYFDTLTADDFAGLAESDDCLLCKRGKRGLKND
jgi:hypothetical protein